jgi:hypothetical protein
MSPQPGQITHETFSVALRRRGAWELLFLVLVAWTCSPLWAAKYLPIQDLPQHLAAIRVLHSFGDGQFDFARYFELQLFRTQYLGYYLAAHLLSYVFDLELANRILISACVAGIPYASRSLLRSLDRDERFALFALPLTYNAHLILGFVNFLMAIALALWGLSLAVRLHSAFKPSRAIGLALLALACFYAHVVPFALLALGVGLIALGRDWRATLRRLLPLVPAVIAALIWTITSPAGKATVHAAGGGDAGPQPTFVPLEVAYADIPNWLTDILHGDTDRSLLRVFAILFALTLCIGALPRAGTPGQAARNPIARADTRALLPRLALLPLIAGILYFIAPTGYDWIWPIAQRFPLLALLFAIPILPKPGPVLGTIVATALVVLTLANVREVSRAFRAFDAEEVADFDAALDSIPPAKRVAGLIFARYSRQVKFSPFIQYVAYYQARKGGAVMFTFADFPQSPFRFRDDDRPPRVQPRWEWLPNHVRRNDLDWYEYLLVRGGPSPCSRERQARCNIVYRGRLWDVWQLR